MKHMEKRQAYGGMLGVCLRFDLSLSNANTFFVGLEPRIGLSIDNLYFRH